MRTPLYLEDLGVGQRFVTGQMLVDEAAIKAFARDFDPQIFHTDSEAAKDTFFGGLAASGWHTAAITMRLLVDGGPAAGQRFTDGWAALSAAEAKSPGRAPPVPATSCMLKAKCWQ